MPRTVAIGEVISRKDLHDRYGGRRQGGISPSRKSPDVLIFSDTSTGRLHGYIYDGPDAGDPTLFHYTGEGQTGDQRMISGNRAILDHVSQGRALRLFKGGWGFRRMNGRLEPDPLTIGAVVRAYERFAVGNVTMGRLAQEFDVGVEQVRKALRNPIYNGWAQRHRGDERVPAPWRADPPVKDELWDRVQDVRRQRSHGGCKPGKWRRGVDPLGGLLYCACGVRIRTNGTAGHPSRRQRIHPANDCESWDRPLTTWGTTHDDPIFAQIAGVRLDPSTVERVVRAVTASEPPPPMEIDAARIERRKRDLALDHAAGRIDDKAYLERMAELRKAVPQRDRQPAVAADQVVRFLRDLGAVWASAVSDEARAELLHAIYERIVVTREGFVEVTLTPHAYRHGLALALPEAVRLQKRPRQDLGTGMHHSVRIPIAGRPEWESAALEWA